MKKTPTKRRATSKVAGTDKGRPEGDVAPIPSTMKDVPRLVADLILAGLGKAQVRAFLVAELNLRPGVSELNKLIEQAKVDLGEQADHYRSIATELTVVRLNDLYTRALKMKDIKTALDVQRAIINFLVGKPAGRKASDEETKPERPIEVGPPPPPRLVGNYAEAMEKQRRRRA